MLMLQGRRHALCAQDAIVEQPFQDIYVHWIGCPCEGGAQQLDGVVNSAGFLGEPRQWNPVGIVLRTKRKVRS
jgi:hypothetical protein